MHRRRGVGVSAVRKKRESDERYASLAEKLDATEDKHVTEFVDSFRVALEAFAKKHKKKIRDDPTFRTRFSAMCAEIGVDPLQSSKGVWAELMGVGDFYYELGVKIIELCAATRQVNGGLISLDEVESQLRDTNLTRDDIKRAVAKLSVLGNGLRIIDDGKTLLSVPVELNRDHIVALELARSSGFVSLSDLAARLGGNTKSQQNSRATIVLDQLTKNGFAWVDYQTDGEVFRRKGKGIPDEKSSHKVGHSDHRERAFFFPSLWLEARSQQMIEP